MRMATQNETVVLTIDREDDRVLVVPENRDLFCLRVQQAIEACRIFANLQQRFEEQLNSLKDRLGAWIKDRSDKIERAILTLREDTFWLLIVMKGTKFDDDLEEDISSLILDIAGDPQYSAINFDAQVLPFCSEAAYKSFCNPAWWIEYRKRDGDSVGARQTSAA